MARIEFVGGPKDGEWMVVHEGERIELSGPPAPWPPEEPDPNDPAKTRVLGRYVRTEESSADREIWRWEAA